MMAEKVKVIRRCAWCRKILGTEVWEKTSVFHYDGCETHGICSNCINMELADAMALKVKEIDRELNLLNDVYI